MRDYVAPNLMAQGSWLAGRLAGRNEETGPVGSAEIDLDPFCARPYTPARTFVRAAKELRRLRT